MEPWEAERVCRGNYGVLWGEPVVVLVPQCMVQVVQDIVRTEKAYVAYLKTTLDGFPEVVYGPVLPGLSVSGLDEGMDGIYSLATGCCGF